MKKPTARLILGCDPAASRRSVTLIHSGRISDSSHRLSPIQPPQSTVDIVQGNEAPAKTKTAQNQKTMKKLKAKSIRPRNATLLTVVTLLTLATFWTFHAQTTRIPPDP